MAQSLKHNFRRQGTRRYQKEKLIRTWKREISLKNDKVFVQFLLLDFLHLDHLTGLMEQLDLDHRYRPMWSSMWIELGIILIPLRIHHFNCRMGCYLPFQINLHRFHNFYWVMAQIFNLLVCLVYFGCFS